MITEEMQLDRKFFLEALETQPEAEMRTHGVMCDNGKYCAMGMAATMVDIDVPEGIGDKEDIYADIQEAYSLTDLQCGNIISMNDKITFDIDHRGAVVNVRYINSWMDIAAYLRYEWNM